MEQNTVMNSIYWASALGKELFKKLSKCYTLLRPTFQMRKVKPRQVVLLCIVSAHLNQDLEAGTWALVLSAIALVSFWFTLWFCWPQDYPSKWLHLLWDQWSNTNRRNLKAYLASFIYNLAWWVDESEGTGLWCTHRPQGAISAPWLPPLLLYGLASSQLLAKKHQRFVLAYCTSSCAQLLEVEGSGHV